MAGRGADMKTVKEILLKPKKGGRKGSGSKKHGRNLVKCAKYKSLGTRERNKARKMKKQAKFEAKKKGAS